MNKFEKLVQEVSVALGLNKVKFSENVLSDGTILVYEKLEVGVEIFVKDTEGNQLPATDGEYTLEDGTKISVKDGKIESIEAIEPVVDAENMAEEDYGIEDLKSKIDLSVNGNFTVSFEVKDGIVVWGEVISDETIVEEMTKNLKAEFSSQTNSIKEEYETKLSKQKEDYDAKIKSLSKSVGSSNLIQAPVETEDVKLTKQDVLKARIVNRKNN